MTPFSQHSFTLKALEKIYQVRTKDPKFMDPMTHV